VADGAGIRFVHRSPFTEERHLHLTMGSGVAWLNFDRDGWPDLYLAQGRGWAGADREPNDGRPIDRLFRNAGGRFHDVTQFVGIDEAEYTMGLAVGDYDNDGFPDLYISNFGPNRLLHNNGDGTFSDVSAMTGTGHSGYGASCTWTDVDGDGCLDLYVTNYVRIDRRNYTVCSQEYRGRKVHVLCPPRKYEFEADVLYRNEGDGRFTDVSLAAGIAAVEPQPGLGVVTGDLDDDGDLDLYVANDTTPNQLWANDGQGHFTDVGPLSGTALDRNGEAQAGMGVAAGDVDADGRLDLFVTNYYGESNTLYRNEGAGLFLDVTDELGLGAPSRTRLGFGTLLADFDHDTQLDVFIANGHLSDRLPDIGQNVPFRQCAQLICHAGSRFIDASDQAGPYFQRELLGRGCAAADYDRDGRLDVAVQHLNDPPALLRNTTQTRGAALQLRLIGVHGSRDAVGAQVDVEYPGGALRRHRGGSASYLSCGEGRLVIGIGEHPVATRVRVQWLGGAAETWHDVPAGRVVRLIEGRGTPDTVLAP
jgi:hypothetical protein